MHRASETAASPRNLAATVLLAVIAGLVGCSRGDSPTSFNGTVLRVGFGLTTGQTPRAGLQQVINNIALEGLVNPGTDGRPQPKLAEAWTVADEGLSWRVKLKPDVTLHDGTALTAAMVREVLLERLPDFLGPAFSDVLAIKESSTTELEFALREPSAFLLEGLDVPIQKRGSSSGTGPFHPTYRGSDRVEMHAHDRYHAGTPVVTRIEIKPYASVRSAWADMLRGEVDLLYEVGLDALDLFAGSSTVKIFAHARPYAYNVLLNVRRPVLKSSEFRRLLNAAINRDLLVSEILKGHGAPADGPIWPKSWTYDPALPRFEYSPRAVGSGGSDRAFHCIFSDPSHERIALELQRQLEAVGIAVTLESLPIDKALERVQRGDFDAFLADAANGPGLLRPYLFWHTGGPFNWGGFSSAAVDAALDSVRHASDESEYKAGAAAFQRAVIEDPPAIFLAWSERARAVSTRFEVPAEPGRDILSTLRLWRPVADK